ncbi:MAG: acyloxyacyl hydrolase [Balneola sp.]
MIRFSKAILFIFVFLAFQPGNITAQKKLTDQPIQFRVWSGYSFNSVYFLGKTTNARSAIVGIGFKTPIRKYGSDLLLYYTTDLIPYIYFDYPKRDDNDRPTELQGLGISPIGFLLEKKINNFLSYELSVSGSFILVDHEFPTDNGRKLNFTFDPSLTLQANLSESVNLSGGYKFHHISNAQTGKENPGLDSNFLFLNITIK